MSGMRDSFESRDTHFAEVNRDGHGDGLTVGVFLMLTFVARKLTNAQVVL